MSEKAVVFDFENSVAFMPNVAASVSFPAGLETQKRPHSTPKQDVIDLSGLIANWGPNNDYPQKVIKAVQGTFMGEALDKKIRFLLSNKLYWAYYEGTNADGTDILRGTKWDDPWNRFIHNVAFKRYLRESASDFYWFFNVFPELLVSVDRSQIISIATQEAAFCRWKLNQDKNMIDKCVINSDWVEHKPDYNIEVATIDKYEIGAVDKLRNSSVYKFIYPLSYPTPGKTYYQLAHWHSVIENGWMDVAKAIPLFKKELMKDQITLKYHIAVPSWWWSWKYPGFESFTQEKRTELITEELNSLNKFLTSKESQGGVLMTTYLFDQPNTKQYAEWKITPIDDKIKDGKYIEDSQEASSHLLYAAGLDQALFGQGPGKGMGSGSGSDARVAFNIYMATIEPHLDFILEPLYFIKDYNRWPANLVLRWTKPFIETLNTGRQTTEKTTNITSDGTN
jgi:hypothetical protein